MNDQKTPCEKCREEKGPQPVPYIVHESELARMERCNRRIAWIAAGTAALAVLSNAAWLLHYAGIF